MRQSRAESPPPRWRILSTYVRPADAARRLEQAFRLLLNPLRRRRAPPHSKGVPTMRVAIYARVSTGRQERDQTIDSQLTSLRQWVTSQGHELPDALVFKDEGYSGTGWTTGLDRLRDAAREGEFEVLAVHSPDRLARKYAYQVLLLEELHKAGCPVVFVQRPHSEDPHDQLLLQIQGAVAEYERTVLGERFRRGKIQKARAGLWTAGKAPYGYRYIPKRDAAPGHLDVDEAEAEVVRMLYRWLMKKRTTVPADLQAPGRRAVAPAAASACGPTRLCTASSRTPPTPGPPT